MIDHMLCAETSIKRSLMLLLDGQLAKFKGYEAKPTCICRKIDWSEPHALDLNYIYKQDSSGLLSLTSRGRESLLIVHACILSFSVIILGFTSIVRKIYIYIFISPYIFVIV